MAYKAIDVANWFIHRAAEFGDATTHLKVQKLLYFAQAWSLTLHEKELFSEDMEAWAHGPVVPELFHHFKEHGWNALPVPTDEDLVKFDGEAADVLEQVLNTYGEYSAKRLEALTHKDNPWIEARGDCAPEARCSTVMSKERIKHFFAQKYMTDGK